MSPPRPDSRSEYFTPDEVLTHVRAFFGGAIPIDPATIASNPTGALRFFTKIDNGLELPWQGPGVFVSPPGGRELKLWVKKAGQEAELDTPIVALLPANAGFGNAYWQDALLSKRLTAVCWLRKKVPFLDADRNPFRRYPYASCLVGLNTDPAQFMACFTSVGRTVSLAHLGGAA